MSSTIFPSVPWRLLPLALALLLAACETPVNSLRAQRLGTDAPPAPASVQPRALALALQATPDGRALAPESLRQANELLSSQGRIDSQVLTITPFNPRGAQLASRLAAALARSGARPPHVEPVPADGQRLAEAGAAGWDLELQSEALVVQTPHCQIADSGNWAIHPFKGVGTLGCANRANIARMASDPRDLTRPRALEGADGKAAAQAVERYQNGDIRDPIDIDFDSDD